MESSSICREEFEFREEEPRTPISLRTQTDARVPQYTDGRDSVRMVSEKEHGTLILSHTQLMHVCRTTLMDVTVCGWCRWRRRSSLRTLPTR